MKTMELKECNENDLRKQYPASHFLDEIFDQEIIGFQKEGTMGIVINRINLNLKK